MEISDKNIASLFLALKNTQLRDDEKQQLNDIGWLLSRSKTDKEKNTNRKLAEQNLSDLLNGNSDLYHLFEDYQTRLAEISDETLLSFVPKRDDLRVNRPDLFPDPQIVEKGPHGILTIEKSDEIENVALDIFSSSDPQETIRSLDLNKLEQFLSH